MEQGEDFDSPPPTYQHHDPAHFAVNILKHHRQHTKTCLVQTSTRTNPQKDKALSYA